MAGLKSCAAAELILGLPRFLSRPWDHFCNGDARVLRRGSTRKTANSPLDDRLLNAPSQSSLIYTDPPALSPNHDASCQTAPKEGRSSAAAFTISFEIPNMPAILSSSQFSR